MNVAPAGQICTLRVGGSAAVGSTPAVSPGDRLFEYRMNTEYNDLKTYDAAKDAQEKRDKTICTTRNKKVGNDYVEIANPYCILGGGVGTVRKPDPSGGAKCVTYDCPPDWKREGSYCTKPLKDASIDRRSKCDERWYDWFMIPNYHLGNKYQYDNDGQCRLPCAPKNVPYYTTDPVDGAKTSLMGSPDKLDRCVSKDNYFQGKYADSSDFCPLAWIHRLSASPNTIQSKLTDMYTRFGIEEGDSNLLINDNFRTLSSSERKERDAAGLSARALSFFENVAEPSGDVASACVTLNTTSRLLDAYAVCDAVSSNTFEIPSGSSNIVEPILKQACNAVFCSQNNNALDMILKEPICFPPPPPVNTDEEEDPAAPTADNETSFMRESVMNAAYIVIFGIMAVLFWFVWHDIIFPYIVQPFVWWPILALVFKVSHGSVGQPYSVSAMKFAFKSENIKKALVAQAAAAS